MYLIKIRTGGLNFFKDTIFMFRYYYNIMQLNQDKHIRVGAVLAAADLDGGKHGSYADAFILAA